MIKARVFALAVVIITLVMFYVVVVGYFMRSEKCDSSNPQNKVQTWCVQMDK